MLGGAPPPTPGEVVHRYQHIQRRPDGFVNADELQMIRDYSITQAAYLYAQAAATRRPCRYHERGLIEEIRRRALATVGLSANTWLNRMRHVFFQPVISAIGRARLDDLGRLEIRPPRGET